MSNFDLWEIAKLWGSFVLYAFLSSYFLKELIEKKEDAPHLVIVFNLILDLSLLAITIIKIATVEL